MKRIRVIQPSLRGLPLLSRRLGAIFSNYVIREVTIPMIMALVGLVILILAKDILGFMDFIINRGFGVAVIAMIASSALSSGRAASEANGDWLLVC